MPGPRSAIRETRAITILLLLIGMALVTWVVFSAILRRRTQLISVRGMSTTADIGRLNDMPRVQARDLTMTGSDSARLTVVTPSDAEGARSGAGGTETEFLIAINDGDPGFAILNQWIEDQSVLGMVVPPESRLLRLRCLDDLQPLTLRRLDT
jgi:hypothetical protein